LNKKTFHLSRESGFIMLCLLPALLLVAVLIYYPVMQGIIIAFRNFSLYDLTDTHFVGFGNFKTVFADPAFRQALGQSASWVFISLFFQFTLGLTLALLLKSRFRGRGIYQGMIFFPWAMSGFLIGLIWRWMFNGQNGVINDLLLRTGLIDQQIPFLSHPKWAMASVIIANVWYGVTFFAIMLLAALQSVPNEVYEAAEIDGAGSAKRLLWITIPYILPTILTTVLLRVIWIFNFPDLIYAMTNGGPAGSTHILSTYMIEKIIFAQDYGQAYAVGVVIIVLLVLFTQFYLASTKYKNAGDF